MHVSYVTGYRLLLDLYDPRLLQSVGSGQKWMSGNLHAFGTVETWCQQKLDTCSQQMLFDARKTLQNCLSITIPMEEFVRNNPS